MCRVASIAFSLGVAGGLIVSSAAQAAPPQKTVKATKTKHKKSASVITRVAQLPPIALSGSGRDRRVLRLERLGYVFQEFALLPELTAEENVYLPALMSGHSRAECRRVAGHDRAR
jgi:ABC-type lipoprotein export system ATPase subunit